VSLKLSKKIRNFRLKSNIRFLMKKRVYII